MKIFTIHSKQNTLEDLEDIVIIEEGFSWFAAILHVFWTLYHKMWLVSLILFSLEILLLTIEMKTIVSAPVIGALRVGFLLFIGANFNDWYRSAIQKKGYIYQGLVSAKNAESARYKYITNMLHRTTFGSGNSLPELLY